MVGSLLFLSELLQIPGGLLVELLQTALAAEFDLLALVHEDIRLAHFPELFTGDDAGVGFVGLHFFFLRRLVSEERRGNKCGMVGSSGECPVGGKTLGLISFSQRSRRFRSRRALEITETEDRDIAAPAMIGLSRVPVIG
jgi:hypothetical protein